MWHHPERPPIQYLRRQYLLDTLWAADSARRIQNETCPVVARAIVPEEDFALRCNGVLALRALNAFAPTGPSRLPG